MEPRYNHLEVEPKIYELWEKSGYFDPDKLPGDRTEPFTIIMPPPNANGALHIGHAVGVTLQDIMIRFARMRGKKALWLPGADHAGFETQVVYDKKLDKEGRDRREISREDLWKEIWDFTQTNKKVMEAQVKRLGASCDWSREKFTLNPEIVHEVQNTFVQMHKDGLIYRGFKVVNWCPKHKTALSDLEVKYVERTDPLYYIKYGPLVIATVRPETKFGDTGIAVNPNDPRYKQYIGKEIEAEGVLGPVKLMVVGDDAVDMTFGTGVVKVTPAHDAVDFDIWKRHEAQIPGPKIVIDENGRLTGDTGPFRGMKVAEARKKVVTAMQEKGLLEKIDPAYVHQVATCYKCGSTLEPLPKPQWFVSVAPLAKKAIDAVTDKSLKIIPEHSEKVYLHWLENIRDWNISRQIVWGIRIPAWYQTPEPKWDLKLYGKETLENIASGRKRFETRAGKPEGAEKDWREMKTDDIIRFTAVHAENEKPFGLEPSTKKIVGTQHFTSIAEMLAALPLSSIAPDMTAEEYTKAMLSYPGSVDRLEKYGVWAIELAEPDKNEAKVSLEKPEGDWTQDPDVFDTWFSSGQWPLLTLGYPDGKDYKEFYPTTVLETAYDILFFWVTRMVMLGTYRTGKVPFSTVYLHGLVRDKDRVKMSKSKGNVVDPLGVAEMYGTDALRMALIVGSTAGQDIVISEDKIRGYRNFSTKIWNAARFVLTNKPVDVKFGVPISADIAGKIATREEVKVLATLKAEIAAHIEQFDFHLAAEKAYHYVWHTFADVIIEAEKKKLHDGTEEEKIESYALLEHLLLESLKMLHPFMPFVTEEIYHIFCPGKMLMVERW
jgi:valyl-tRNA synthetase